MPPFNSSFTRRRFIGQCCAAVGSTGVLSALSQMRLMGAAASPNLMASPTGAMQPDYRALVCLYLNGGNDTNNLLVPTDTSGFNAYAQARGSLALSKEDLLGVTPASTDGRSWGFHPALASVRDLFVGGKLAMLANVGTLVVPTSKAQYQSRSVPLPPQLFSHSDQSVQWQSSIPDQAFKTGWGGRLADLTNAFNENNQISMTITLNGQNSFQVGREVVQFAVRKEGPLELWWNDNPEDAATKVRLGAMRDVMKAEDESLFRSAFGHSTDRALQNSELLGSILAEAAPLTVEFPDTELGQQLRMIAQLISVRDQLGLRRQVFFARLGGWDLHDSQIGAHAELLTELADAMKAFYEATESLNVANDVTTFTASDFGRTMVANGDGSDHGWGSHHLIMGGAVKGGDFYGRVPDLAVGGPDDTKNGRWIPTVSVDEYNATLARWFGVSDTDMPLVLPNIGRFATPDLRFMS
ncbi:MAG: DUF1501 domain-containing protein [Opitutaceae bacterium]|jgi:uncharacterized protein (DUF1501 family)|nr:DUF1501 domain-containing protein [Opitutaceae bacterium]